LVARIEQSLPGMTVAPQAHQRSAQTVVLAHLRHRAAPPAQADLNLLSDFRPSLPETASPETAVPETSSPETSSPETAVPEENRRDAPLPPSRRDR
ncbi:MAG: hypothetical protein ACF788_03035, partial [Novipirellula sp. JB048]